MPGRNRGRIEIQPLGTSRRLQLIERLRLLPRGAVRLAEIDNSEHGDFDPRGWLVRLANGNIVILTDQGAIRPVDRRKAEAALNAL